MLNKIKTIAQFKTIRKKLKKQKKKTVFTNGCFDIIHYGHIKYLAKAKSLADILIVGLNSDVSVKKIKGKNRPINKQHMRSTVLSALEMVDYVVVFTEITPERLIREIKPDILVKGADWKIKDIVGSNFVKSYKGSIKRIPFVKGFSTTKIINKLM
ncbi:MAG: D-glycero-beta-D-manno-heptose 1-phosphate adenylyltransferase [Candidatus Gygaella obscura]|nr:D-glycero-beta-D-manno-heptose 1-phosphate adenylyltransferase [Candidatus Gygaella obscura]